MLHSILHFFCFVMCLETGQGVWKLDMAGMFQYWVKICQICSGIKR